MREFSALRPKSYIFLTGENDESKTVKHRKKCVIKSLTLKIITFLRSNSTGK